MKPEDYNRLVSNIEPDKNLENRLKHRLSQKISAKKHRHRRWPALAAGGLALLVILCLPLFSGPYAPGEPAVSSGQAAILPERSPSSALRLQLVAYAAQKEDDVLTGNYETQGTATLLTSSTEVLLPQYSPLMSSVPGYPFTFGATGPSTLQLQISVTEGELVRWENNQIISLGQSTCVSPNETLYWSPIDQQQPVDIAVLTVTAMDGENVLGKESILIQATDTLGHYTATIQPE